MELIRKYELDMKEEECGILALVNCSIMLPSNSLVPIANKNSVIKFAKWNKMKFSFQNWIL